MIHDAVFEESRAPMVRVGAVANDSPVPPDGQTYVTLKATGIIALGAAFVGGVVGWLLRDSQAVAEEAEEETRRRRRRAA